MEKVLPALIICLWSTISFAQENIISELRRLYEAEKYDSIISKHSDKVNDYSAKAVYYVAMAHYMNANDEKVLELMDLSIEKDKTNPNPYFVKGMTFNYLGKYEKAIEFLNTAVELDSTNANYFSGLGDSYFSQKNYDKALSIYLKATEKKESIDRPFVMIPQIYSELKQSEKALNAYYNSKQNISKETDSYLNVLYNIGLYELLNREYVKSEVAFKELIELVPNDYHSISKLVQVYYGQRDYEKVKPLKEELYKAYNLGKLKDNLEQEFCFDQFTWHDKYIFAFERFAEKEGELYYKHVFYITDKETGKNEFTIQTENSPISKELGGPKYVLGMDNNGTHSTFKYGFEEDFDYGDLKKIVIQVLEEKIK